MSNYVYLATITFQVTVLFDDWLKSRFKCHQMQSLQTRKLAWNENTIASKLHAWCIWKSNEHLRILNTACDVICIYIYTSAWCSLAITSWLEMYSHFSTYLFNGWKNRIWFANMPSSWCLRKQWLIFMLYWLNEAFHLFLSQLLDYSRRKIY